ncbi:glutamate decarboxylase, partial [Shigella dysenteriae]
TSKARIIHQIQLIRGITNYRCGLSSFYPERGRNAGFSSGTYCIDGLLQ